MKDDALPEGARELGEWLKEFWPSLPWRYRILARVRRLFGWPKITFTDAVIPSSKGRDHEG